MILTLKPAIVSVIDNEVDHDLLAEMMGLPDESSQLVKELHTEEVQEGRRETKEAKARNREVQIVAPQAAKKTGM